MKGLKTKATAQKKVFVSLSVFAILSSPVALHASTQHRILDIPNWGFVSKKAHYSKTISHSLIFDQAFDKLSYRPAPEPKASVAIAAPAQAVEPIEVAIHEVQKPLEPVSVTQAPEPTIFKEIPSEWVDTVHAELQKTPEAPKIASNLIPVITIPAVRIPTSTIPSIELPKTLFEQKNLFETSTKIMGAFASKLPTPSPIIDTKPQPVNVAMNQISTPPETPEAPKKPEKTSEDMSVESYATWNQPKAEADVAKIYVISEESMMAGEPKAVVGAEVKWVSEKAGLLSRTDAYGVARTPYARTSSMRFIVSAPGFLPSVGYAIGGLAIPVVLSSEARLAPVIQGLGIVPDPNKTLVLGKILDHKLRPVQNVSVDASLEKPFAVFYSYGDLGIFHPKAKATGPQGDFFISGMRDGIQYFLPSQLVKANVESSTGSLDSEQIREWPASIFDMSGLPSVVTVTIIEPTKATVKTQVLDAQSEDKPDVGVHLTIGGQRGVYVPDGDGYFKLQDVHFRNSAELIEIRAQGFLKTWISAIPSIQNFPSTILLYRQSFLDEILGEHLYDVDTSKGITFGHLRPEQYTRAVEIRVYSNTGKESTEAKIFYGDSENNLTTKQKGTDPLVQSFALGNLEPGEWHVLAIDAKTQKVLGAQVLRVEEGTLSQMQF